MIKERVTEEIEFSTSSFTLEGDAVNFEITDAALVLDFGDEAADCTSVGVEYLYDNASEA